VRLPLARVDSLDSRLAHRYPRGSRPLYSAFRIPTWPLPSVSLFLLPTSDFLLFKFYFPIMNEHPIKPLPADDLSRSLKIARPDTDESLPHLGLVGDTYTILLSGADTDGHYSLIDMHIPPGGGPPPHRHDFEESFTVLEGEIEATFRGEKSTVHAGQTVNIPANAPHSFTNASGAAARLLCICAPAGQEEFFAQVGVPVPTRRSTPPELDQEEQGKLMKKAQELAPKYRTELLPP
jgi:quercetin dioxygenase-like cupin family protein